MIDLIVRELNSIHNQTALLEACDWDESELSKLQALLSEVIDRLEWFDTTSNPLYFDDFVSRVLPSKPKQKNLTNTQISAIINCIKDEAKYLVEDTKLPEA